MHDATTFVACYIDRVVSTLQRYCAAVFITMGMRAGNFWYQLKIIVKILIVLSYTSCHMDALASKFTTVSGGVRVGVEHQAHIIHYELL